MFTILQQEAGEEARLGVLAHWCMFQSLRIQLVNKLNCCQDVGNLSNMADSIRTETHS